MQPGKSSVAASRGRFAFRPRGNFNNGAIFDQQQGLLDPLQRRKQGGGGDRDHREIECYIAKIYALFYRKSLAETIHYKAARYELHEVAPKPRAGRMRVCEWGRR